MQTNIDNYSNSSTKNHYTLLIELGVDAHLLEETQDLDLALLYQRLSLVMNTAYLNNPLQCKARWQLEALAGAESYKTINYTIDKRDNRSASPFHYLAWSGNKEALEWMSRYHQEAFGLKTNDGRTPFHYLAWSGNKEALEWMSRYHQEAFNLKDNNGRTPFHYLAWSGNKEALEWMSRYHQEVFGLKTNDGRTPFHYLASSGNKEAIEWMDTYHQEAFSLKDNAGRTPFHYLAWSGNKEALEWMSRYHQEAFGLKTNDGRTPFHYLAWSGNKEALEWMNRYHQEGFGLKANDGRTPFHYLTRSSNKEALEWMNRYHQEGFGLKANDGSTPFHALASSGNKEAIEWMDTYHQEAFNLKDNNGRTPFHYLARSSNKEALEWMNRYHQEGFGLKANDGSTPFHALASSGNKEALEWMDTYHQEAFNLKDNFGRTPFHYLASSGNKEALEWMNRYHQEAFNLKDNFGSTPFHALALSGNHQALNYALALSPTPQSWALCSSFNEDNSKTITDTLVKALNTNYSLIHLDFNDFSMDEDSQIKVVSSLSRNIGIKRAKVMFIAFMQGLSQPSSKVSLLQFGGLELCSQILSYLLPKEVKTEVIFKEIQTNTNHQSRALVLIDKEIKRLEASNQQNNTFLGFSLEKVHQSSDSKIESLKGLQQIIKDNRIDSLTAKVTEWEKENHATLATQRNTMMGGFFNKPKTQTQEAVEQIKEVLGVGFAEKLDGFAVCK